MQSIFNNYFQNISDPRSIRNQRHPLMQGYRIREYPFRLIFGKMLINCMFKHI